MIRFVTQTQESSTQLVGSTMIKIPQNLQPILTLPGVIILFLAREDAFARACTLPIAHCSWASRAFCGLSTSAELLIRQPRKKLYLIWITCLKGCSSARTRSRLTSYHAVLKRRARCGTNGQRFRNFLIRTGSGQRYRRHSSGKITNDRWVFQVSSTRKSL